MSTAKRLPSCRLITAPFSIVLLLLLVLATALPVDAATVLGPIFDPIGNKNLYVLGPEPSWTTAQSDAQAISGNLVSIANAAENQFIVSNFLQDFTSTGGPNLSNVPLWIGLWDPTGAAHDDGPGGSSSQHAANFVWVDGATLSYLNWNSGTGEPNDYHSNEYYGTIDFQVAQGIYGPSAIGTWNDVPLIGYPQGGGGNIFPPYYGIAEVSVPEPAPGTVPLPSAAWAGMILLGVMGISRYGRRQHAKV